MRSILTAAMLMMAVCGTARANLYIVTNNISSVTNVTGTFSYDKDRQARMTIFATYASQSLPLNLAGEYTIKWEWRHDTDDVLVQTWSGYVANGAAGKVVVTAALDHIDIGTYRTEVWVLLNTVKVHRVAWNYAVVTNTTAVPQALDVAFPSYGFSGDTNTPAFVRMMINESQATGVVDGANLSLYWTVSGSPVDIVISNPPVASNSNHWDAATGTFHYNTNAWDGTATGGNAMLDYLGGVTNVDGTTAISFSFDPGVSYLHCIARNTLVATNWNYSSVLILQINGSTNGYNTLQAHDPNNDTRPAVDSSYYQWSTLMYGFVLMGVPDGNDGFMGYSYGMLDGSWEFVSNSRGVSMTGKGHSPFYSPFVGPYSFRSDAIWRNDDFATLNPITNITLKVVDVTTTATLAMGSNFQFHVWGNVL